MTIAMVTQLKKTLQLIHLDLGRPRSSQVPLGPHWSMAPVAPAPKLHVKSLNVWPVYVLCDIYPPHPAWWGCWRSSLVQQWLQKFPRIAEGKCARFCLTLAGFFHRQSIILGQTKKELSKGGDPFNLMKQLILLGFLCAHIKTMSLDSGILWGTSVRTV